jgi:hypothetical protein
MIRLIASLLAASALLAAGPTFAALAPSPLAKLLMAAPDGSTVKVPAGTYSGNVIRGLKFTNGITVVPADPAHPPVVRDLSLTDDAGISFQHLDFTAPLYSGVADPTGGKAKGQISYSVGSSDRIAFSGNTFTSDPGGTLGTEPSGIVIESSTHITVSGNDFSHYHNALAHWIDDYVTITGNTFHNMRDDSIRGGSSDITIAGNRAWSNHPDAADTDHPDFIQLWTTGYAPGFHDVKVIGNRYDRGVGRPTQNVFISASGGRWKNVLINGNEFHGGAFNSIDANGVDGLTITNNTVVSFTDYLARIIYSVGPGDTNVVVQGNVAPRYIIEGAPFSQAAPTGNSLNKQVPVTTAVPNTLPVPGGGACP